MNNEQYNKLQLLRTLNHQLVEIMFQKTGLIHGQNERILIDNKYLIFEKTKKQIKIISKEIEKLNNKIQHLLQKTINIRMPVIEYEAYFCKIKILIERIRLLKYFFDFFNHQLERMGSENSFILRTDAYTLFVKEELYMRFN